MLYPNQEPVYPGLKEALNFQEQTPESVLGYKRPEPIIPNLVDILGLDNPAMGMPVTKLK